MTQFNLFTDLPVTELLGPEEFRRFRKAHGLSQSKAGTLIGVKQPQVANFERKHDRLSRHRQRVMLYLIETAGAGGGPVRPAPQLRAAA